MSSDGNEDEEEKKENGSQNHECSISRISDGAELNSDDDISEREEYETKNTLYCYYEKVFLETFLLELYNFLLFL